MNFENLSQRLVRFKISLQSVKGSDISPDQLEYFMLKVDELIDDVVNRLFTIALPDGEKIEVSKALEEILDIRRELTALQSAH